MMRSIHVHDVCEALRLVALYYMSFEVRSTRYQFYHWRNTKAQPCVWRNGLGTVFCRIHDPMAASEPRKSSTSSCSYLVAYVLFRTVFFYDT